MNPWVVIYRFAWFTLGGLLLIAMLCLFSPQYKQYREYQRTEAELEDQIRLEEEMLTLLKRKQEQFRSDPRFVEKIAHEFGLAKQDEVIFKFMDEDSETGPPGSR